MVKFRKLTKKSRNDMNNKDKVYLQCEAETPVTYCSAASRDSDTMLISM